MIQACIVLCDDVLDLFLFFFSREMMESVAFCNESHCSKTSKDGKKKRTNEKYKKGGGGMRRSGGTVCV